MRWNKRQGLGIWDWGLARAVLGLVPAAVLGLVPAVLLVGAPHVGLGFSRAASAQQHSFEEIASGLKHQDPNTRLRAIQILKDADYPQAVVPIAAAVVDTDDRVQLAAIDAERSLFSTRAVPRRKMIGYVIEVRTVTGGDAAAAGQLALKARTVPPQLLTSIAVALRDGNSRVRAEAINLAILLGPYACVGSSEPCAQIGNALVDNINSRESEMRRAAMQALGQLRYPNAVQALSDQLSYRQTGPEALAALEGLAGIGHPISVSTFERSLASSNADVRRLAVEGLARAGHRESIPALQQMGQSERASSVLLALHYANAKLGHVESSLQQLVATLGDTDRRLLAINYLLDLSTSTAPALAASLKDEDADVRRLIADLIGFSRNPAVVPALEAAAKDPDPDVAAAAQRAIERLKLVEPRAARGDGAPQAKRRGAGRGAPATHL